MAARAAAALLALANHPPVEHEVPVAVSNDVLLYGLA
jgi:hypothetical protein